MRRLAFVFALAVLSAPLPAEPQQAGKVHGIGWLSPAPPSEADPYLGHFRTALRERGYAEGRDFTVEFRGANRDAGRYPELAAELVRAKVDVIVTAGGPASLAAARNATKSIPIVMIASSTDPVGTGIIASYARPGGNVTGLTAAPAELGGKQLQLLKEAVPRLTQVGVLRDGTLGPFGGWSTETATAVEQLGVKLVVLEVRTPEELEGAFERATRERVGALVVVSTPLFSGQRTRIAELALRRRLPAISSWRYWAEVGLLMAYGASLEDQFRRAAIYVDKILKGARPADLPVEQPTKFELVVNLKTAKALGVTIPPSVLARADEILQ